MSAIEQAEPRRRLHTVAEAASELRVSKTMVFKLIREGKLVPTKIGTRTLIADAELDRLLSEARS